MIIENVWFQHFCKKNVDPEKVVRNLSGSLYSAKLHVKDMIRN